MEQKKSLLERRLEMANQNVADMTWAVQKYSMGMHDGQTTFWGRYKYHIYLVIAIISCGLVVHWAISTLLSKVFFFIGGLFALRVAINAVLKK